MHLNSSVFAGRLVAASALLACLLHVSIVLAASAPAAPAGLTATAGAAQVSLGWKASTGAAKYNVKRSTVSGSGYATIATVTALTFVDTTTTKLVPGTPYFYVVSAVSSAGEGANSGPAGATPIFAAPTGPTAVPGAAQVSLTWKASTGATKYNIKRGTTDGSGYATIATATALTFVDTVAATALVPGQQYYYVVSAVDTFTESPNSIQVAAKPTFAAPGTLTATAGPAQVSLTWKASSGASNYNVKRSTVSGSGYATLVNVSTLAFTDTVATGLVPGTKYYYTVTAVDACCESANSNSPSATPLLPKPAAPSGVTATPGTGQVSLTWNTTAWAASYNVKRSTSSASGYTTVKSVTTNNFTDTVANGLTVGKLYYYEISAVNASGESPNSTPASASPAPPSTQVTVTVNTLANRHLISPYIYGANFTADKAYITTGGVTLTRWGGNNASRYNWKLNAKNIDADWYFENSDWGTPNSLDYVSQAVAAGGSPIMTIPMLSWVAKDKTSYSFSVKKYGKQCSTDPYDSTGDKGDGIMPGSGCIQAWIPLTGNDPKDANIELLDSPGTSDPSGAVYRSQWVAALAPNFGKQPHFYQLDNEPEIWSGTHRDVHPAPVGYDELATDMVKDAMALKSFDPQAKILGPVFDSWWFYWNGADPADKPAHGGLDFLPWIMNEILLNDVVNNKRTFDYYDVHAYFNAPDTSKMTQAQKRAAALRVTRDWWDPTYISEGGAVNQVHTTALQPDRTVAFAIPRMRAIANSIYPGTPASFTEWNGALAGESDFSTALVDADAYGILGQGRMWGATRWVAADASTSAFQTLVLYRNADGKHNGFQTVSVAATNTADPNLFSAFAATNPAGTALTLMVVNKDPNNQAVVTFNIAGFNPSTMTTYSLTQASPTKIVASSSQSWSGTQTFAPYSATLIVVSGQTAQPVAAEWDLNPDTFLMNTSSTTTISPIILSGTGSVTLTSATSTGGVALTLTQPKLPALSSASPIAAVLTINTPSTPGLYPFTVTGTDSAGVTQTQQGWILCTVPAATLTKTGDNQSAARGSKLTLTANYTPGGPPVYSTGPAGAVPGGVSILFTASAGTLSQRIVRTDSSGKATVTLTLPPNPGAVTVTATGPVFWGTPTATFTETAQ